MPTSTNWPFLIALALILTSECYLIIGISTLKADPKSSMRRVYMLSCACLAVWSSLYGMMAIAGRESHIRLFWSAGFFASSIFFAAWLHFLLKLAAYQGPHQRRWVVFFYASCIALATLCIASDDVVFVDTTFGTQFYYADSLVFRLTIAYYFLMLIVISLLQLRWRQGARLKRQRRQALVFIVLTFLVTPPGLLFDFALPGFFNTPIVPMTTVLVLFVSLQLYFTLRANRGLNVTVENAADIIFKSVTMPVLLLDYRNIVVLANDAAQAFFGDSPGALVGTNISQLMLVGEEAPSSSMFDDGFDSELVTVYAKEGERTCDMLLAVSKDRYGDVLSKVVALHDITEMQTALERAREASRAKGDFLSRMSHEIRTPMNAIIGMTRIGRSTDDPERMQYCLGKIDGASNHLLGLINDVLDMSKIEADKLELSKDRFDLEKAIENVCNVVAVKAEEKRIAFLVEFDPTLPREVWGDELRLAQVITNLLSNAVKFTPERGTVRLSAWPAPSEQSDGEAIFIEVSDTGIGISAEQMPRLFASFEQADDSIARTYGGTGLGLAISKRIAELMGGGISVESKVGEGSRFRLTVRLARADQPAIRPLHSPAAYRGLRVLVVDDSNEILAFFERFLQRLAIGYDLADSGEAAIALATASAGTQEPYRIVFVDYLMEDLDGIETTRRLRNILGERACIVMISVSNWAEIERDATGAGVDKFLQKPLFSSAIFDSINELVMDKASPTKHAAPASSSVPSLDKYRLLLAEDIEINREIVMTLLEDTHISIDCAQDGQEAVRMVADGQAAYDIIFMDVQMPRMDGLEATRHIRALDTPYAKNIPIVAMTANAFKEDVDACLAAGMDDHIGKPIDFDEMLMKLTHYLGHGENVRAVR